MVAKNMQISPTLELICLLWNLNFLSYFASIKKKVANAQAWPCPLSSPGVAPLSIWEAAEKWTCQELI